MTSGSLRFIEGEKTRVLIVEDDAEYAKIISLFLSRSTTQQFEVSIAGTLSGCLQQMQQADFDIILLDLSLPESHGVSTFYTLHANAGNTPIVVLSGTDDEYVAIEAVRGGAQDYLVKGHADAALIMRSIRYALERKRAEEALRKSEEHFRSLIENANDLIVLINDEQHITYASPSHNHILNYKSTELLGQPIIQFIHPDDIEHLLAAILDVRSMKVFDATIDFRIQHRDRKWHTFEGHIKKILEQDNTERVVINSNDITERVKNQRELAKAYDATLEGWSLALELRDKDTDGHSKRVTAITMKLAVAMGVDRDELVNVRRGSLLHDIGKMGIPDRILQKKDELDKDEWEIMRKHPEYAYQMLRQIEYLHPALEIPYSHHEKWDGSGYPQGLKGKEIPLAARIFAIADVFDALISNRSYSEPWSDEKAKEYIKAETGTHFDPEIVEVFLEIF